MARAFAHGAMGRRIDPSLGGGGPIELCLVVRERDVAPWQERSLMVRWVVGSILHRGGWGVLSYFLSGQRDVAPC